MKTTSVWKKPEFWVSAITSVSGLLLAFGVITPEQSNAVTSVAQQVIGAVLAILSASKFVSVQHAARVEVFRAMCALSADETCKGKAKALVAPEDKVSAIARMAGL